MCGIEMSLKITKFKSNVYCKTIFITLSLVCLVCALVIITAQIVSAYHHWARARKTLFSKAKIPVISGKNLFNFFNRRRNMKICRNLTCFCNQLLRQYILLDIISLKYLKILRFWILLFSFLISSQEAKLIYPN